MGSTLIPWLDFSAKPKVLVIGDVILDEYIDGIVSRISPEAPVPIHHVQKRWATAGGAANVARNITKSAPKCPPPMNTRLIENDYKMISKSTLGASLSQFHPFWTLLTHLEAILA